MNVMKLNQEEQAGKPLHYRIGYRLVGKTPWLEDVKRRNELINRLMKLSIHAQAPVTNVKVYPCGLSFDVALGYHQHVMDIANYFGLQLANRFNQIAPELHFRQLINVKSSMARIWSHPYLIQTLSNPDVASSDKYFQV